MIEMLPEGWKSATLAQIGEWSSGGTPSRRASTNFGGDIPWIKSGDLPDGPVLETEETITELGLKTSSAKIMPVGTVSIALYGATIGKLGILTFPAATNQACASVVPKHALIDRLYLFHYLLSQRQQLIELGQGGAQPNISQEILKGYPIPLAPIAEQYRIVAKLEQLLTRVRICQERLKKILEILERFKRSVVAAACSGRLTTDWRTANPSSPSAELIVREIRERRDRDANSVAQRARLHEIFELAEDDSADLPANWRFAALHKLSTFQYGTSAKSSRSGKIPVLRMGNIQDGEVDWTDLVFTSNDREAKTFALSPNTVLFNRTNSPELVGKTAIYRGNRPAIFAGYLIRVNPVPELDPEYLNLCLNAPRAREFCARVKSDGVSQSNINAQKLGTFEVPMCSIEEQREIVRRTDQLLQTARRIEVRLARSIELAENLSRSILSKAFTGTLVQPEAELTRSEGRPLQSADDASGRPRPHANRRARRD